MGEKTDNGFLSDKTKVRIGLGVALLIIGTIISCTAKAVLVFTKFSSTVERIEASQLRAERNSIHIADLDYTAVQFNDLNRDIPIAGKATISVKFPDTRVTIAGRLTSPKENP